MIQRRLSEATLFFCCITWETEVVGKSKFASLAAGAAILLGAVAYVTKLLPAKAIQITEDSVGWSKADDFRWIVLSGDPASKIFHTVDTKSRLDEKRKVTSLRGPMALSISHKEDKQKTPPYLAWYKIADPIKEDNGSWTLEDAENRKPYSVDLAAASFLLTPAKRLTSGPPKKEPSDLDIFKAYEISKSSCEPIELQQDHPLFGRMAATATPKYLCMPVEESHHDEVFPIKKPGFCFVVYELINPAELEDKMTLTSIDQFGIHRLSATQSSLICVPARVRSPQ